MHILPSVAQYYKYLIPSWRSLPMFLNVYIIINILYIYLFFTRI
jgi:hypothetical protein